MFNFKTLFVSPMRRTVETAYHIFRSHPNFREMEFIIHPDLREKISITGDLPLKDSLDYLLKDY